MNEKEEKKIWQQQVGFGYSFSIEKEIRNGNDTKYPDKIILKASLNGHADTSEESLTLLEAAKTQIYESLKEVPA